jgi:hypothetical protein
MEDYRVSGKGIQVQSTLPSDLISLGLMFLLYQGHLWIRVDSVTLIHAFHYLRYTNDHPDLDSHKPLG